jgi:hypothetical protein
MSYIGQEPGQGQAERFLFTAAGTGTAVTADDDGVSVGYTVGQVSVYLNGVKQVIGTGKDVTATDGSTITFLASYVSGDVIEVIALSTFSPADTVPATGGTFTGAVTASAGVVGNLTGNASGTAATVTGATQSAITTATNLTSVGTLTGFTSTGIDDGAVGATAITINSSEHVLIGTTTDGTTADGTVIRDGGEVLITRTDNPPLLLNRANSTGVVAEIRQANSAVGYISANAGGMGVYLGGTAGANHLDDYEEGTWTPVNGSLTTLTLTAYTATYTKIGNMVTANFQLTNGSLTASQGQNISGLPFSANQDGRGVSCDRGPERSQVVLVQGTLIYFAGAIGSDTNGITVTYFTSS